MDVAGNRRRGFFQLDSPKNEPTCLMNQSFSHLWKYAGRDGIEQRNFYIAWAIG